MAIQRFGNPDGMALVEIAAPEPEAGQVVIAIEAIGVGGDFVELSGGVSSVDAVALGGPVPVAHFALQHAHFKTGDTVLVRGAAGSIGIAAVEIAARGGAGAVAVTTLSAQWGERLRALGATEVLDRSGKGDAAYDLIIDIVGGPDLPDFIDRLAPNGRLMDGIVLTP
ncbi:hypothetical protein [Actinoplanes derwentensis]|uniref:hypothetical protein n=1 Tax=Actinoplanes derwentensis TaxID=113562 RepID=UPI000B890625|nr:hypothetical protein [Actinoplanes derwentensis]